MGVTDALYCAKAASVPRVQGRLIPKPNTCRFAQIFDVSGYIHRFNSALQARMAHSSQTILSLGTKEDECRNIANMIIAEINENLNMETDVYIVFDGKASEEKKRVGKYVETDDDDWESLEGIEKIIKRYNNVANDVEFTTRILEALVPYEWEHVDASLLMLCRGSSDERISEVIMPYIERWGHEELITKTIASNSRPPSALYRILKEEIVSRETTWHLVQAEGEADHEIARIALQHEYKCTIYSGDSDMFLITLAESVNWSTRKIDRRTRAFDMWTTAIANLCINEESVGNLDNVITYIKDTIGADANIYTACIVAIASNFLCNPSDYHEGVRGVGKKAISNNLSKGRFCLQTLPQAVPRAVLVNWYEHWAAMGEWIDANCVMTTSDNLAFFQTYAKEIYNSARTYSGIGVYCRSDDLITNICRHMATLTCPDDTPEKIKAFYIENGQEYLESVKDIYYVSFRCT